MKNPQRKSWIFKTVSFTLLEAMYEVTTRILSYYVYAVKAQFRLKKVLQTQVFGVYSPAGYVEVKGTDYSLAGLKIDNVLQRNTRTH